MDLLIRKMRIEDVDDVYTLGTDKKEFSTANGSFWSKDQLRHWCQSPSDILLVAEKNGEIIGFSFYAAHVPTGKVTWENIYIAPAARGSGVATKLVEEGLRQTRALGYTYIMLCVNAEDQERFAIFVERYGFKKGDSVLWVDKIL